MLSAEGSARFRNGFLKDFLCWEGSVRFRKVPRRFREVPQGSAKVPQGSATFLFFCFFCFFVWIVYFRKGSASCHKIEKPKLNTTPCWGLADMILLLILRIPLSLNLKDDYFG